MTIVRKYLKMFTMLQNYKNKQQLRIVLKTVQTNLLLFVFAAIRQVALELLVTTPMRHSRPILPVQLYKCTPKFMFLFLRSCLVFNLSLLGVVQIFFLF